jgi:transposase, IS30 family
MLVERRTRFVMLGYLGNDRATQRVIDALEAQIVQLPGHLTRALSWDQATSWPRAPRSLSRLACRCSSAYPDSRWQRSSNENTNGLLREYFPNGAGLALHGQAELDWIAALLNGRPRRTLGWMNPAEKMAERLAKAPPSQ